MKYMAKVVDARYSAEDLVEFRTSLQQQICFLGN